jgi:hypothetical protein
MNIDRSFFLFSSGFYRENEERQNNFFFLKKKNTLGNGAGVLLYIGR